MKKELRKMRDRPYYRAKISHRCAVRTLESIQDILRPDVGTIAWGSYSRYGENFDSGVYDMITKIKQLKIDADKYYELQNMLNKTVNYK